MFRNSGRPTPQSPGLWTPGRGPAVVIAALTLARGAAGSQLAGEPDRAGTYNILHTFTWSQDPTGNLIIGAVGNLYGTTSNGGSAKCSGACGAVWKLVRNPKGWRVSILHAFTGGADGWFPFAGGVIFDAAGNLLSQV